MKLVATTFVVLLAAACLRSEVRVYAWQDGGGTLSFFLAPEAIAKEIEAAPGSVPKVFRVYGAKRPEDAWAYGLVVEGSGRVSEKDKLALFEQFPTPDPIEIESGFVEVDRQRGVVRVALRVKQSGEITDFKGNGTFSDKKKKKPNPESSVSAQPETGHLLNKPMRNGDR